MHSAAFATHCPLPTVHCPLPTAHLGCGFPRAGTFVVNHPGSADLLHAGPVDVVVPRGRGGEFPLDFPQSIGLIAFHRDQVIAFRVEHLLADFPLAEQRLAQDDTPFENQVLEQFERPPVFVGFLLDARLAQDRSGLMIDGGQEMHGLGRRSQRGAQTLAVDADPDQPFVAASPTQQTTNNRRQQGG